MDSLSTVRKCDHVVADGDSTSAIFVHQTLPLRIFGKADSGIRPSEAHACKPAPQFAATARICAGLTRPPARGGVLSLDQGGRFPVKTKGRQEL